MIMRCKDAEGTEISSLVLQWLIPQQTDSALIQMFVKSIQSHCVISIQEENKAPGFFELEARRSGG